MLAGFHNTRVEPLRMLYSRLSRTRGVSLSSSLAASGITRLGSLLWVFGRQCSRGWSRQKPPYFTCNGKEVQPNAGTHEVPQFRNASKRFSIRKSKKIVDRRRDRTCNLLIRSQAPCHWASRPVPCPRFLNLDHITRVFCSR